MARYLAIRVGTGALTVVGVVLLVFFIVRVLPGDAALVRGVGSGDPAYVDEIRHQYGLDRPLLAQFGSYLNGLIHGDLGTSVRTSMPVSGELLSRLPATLELAVYAVVVSAMCGILFGGVAALRPGGIIDGACRVYESIGSSMAVFWLGLVLTYVFFFKLGLFPPPIDRLPTGIMPPPQVTGFYTIDSLLAGQWGTFGDSLKQLALPVITLSVGGTAAVLKMVRMAMTGVLASEFVRTARGLQLGKVEIFLRDGLRNAMIPVLTSIGLLFGYLLGGNILVEIIFAWPGVGRYAYTAIQSHDLAALQGFVILTAVLYVGLNVVVDLLYGVLDPRVRKSARPAMTS